MALFTPLPIKRIDPRERKILSLEKYIEYRERLSDYGWPAMLVSTHNDALLYSSFPGLRPLRPIDRMNARRRSPSELP